MLAFNFQAISFSNEGNDFWFHLWKNFVSLAVLCDTVFHWHTIRLQNSSLWQIRINGCVRRLKGDYKSMLDLILCSYFAINCYHSIPGGSFLVCWEICSCCKNNKKIKVENFRAENYRARNRKTRNYWADWKRIWPDRSHKWPGKSKFRKTRS